jgi:hypothetical protein
VARARGSAQARSRPEIPGGFPAAAYAPSLVTGLDHTAPLPPPANWPESLKRLVYTHITGGVPWKDWIRPFANHSQEPMWLALRATGRHFRGGFKVITNDEAWRICVVKARALVVEELAA